jgi:hypothetical protein
MLSAASMPSLPSSLNPLLFLPPAVVIALIGAGLAAVLLDQLDGSFRTEREVTDALGISCIGSVPDPNRAKKSKSGLRNFKMLSPASWTAVWRGKSENLTNMGKVRLRGYFSSSRPAGVPPDRLIPQDEQYTEAIRSVVATLQFGNLRITNRTRGSVDRSLVQAPINRRRDWEMCR